MRQHFFYRNTRARDHLELFLVSAVTSLLFLRFILYLSGYPQVGGGSLHIAHMLYGGLLMLVAITLMLSFIGAKIQRLAAIIGGVGFGIFIDELGKFITKNNNYFFRPTIGIIYAVFILLYLSFNFISRSRSFSEREYQLNALNQFEEAIVKDMDHLEKAQMRQLLAKTDQTNPITVGLLELLRNVKPLKDPGVSWYRRLVPNLSRGYARMVSARHSNRILGLLFITESMGFLIAVSLGLAHSFDSVTDLIHNHATYGSNLVIGQLIATVIAAAFVLAGALQLTRSRLLGFEQFRRAILVNIFLTEFFIFSRIQFGAIPGFILNLLLLTCLRFAIRQELRLSTTKQ